MLAIRRIPTRSNMKSHHLNMAHDIIMEISGGSLVLYCVSQWFSLQMGSVPFTLHKQTLEHVTSNGARSIDQLPDWILAW